MIPHNNELQAKFGKRGLVVVGVTNEPSKLVEKYIADNKVEYPIFIEKSFKSANALGLEGYPTAYLVDTKGNVVWKGNPGGFPEAELEKVLQGARVPGFKLPAALKSLEKPLESGNFAKAYEGAKALLAGKLDDEAEKSAQELLARIEGDAKSLVTSAAGHAGSHQWVDAVGEYETVVKGYTGVPGAEGADAKLKELQADPEVKKAVKAQELLAKADELQNSKDYDKAHDAYKSIAKTYADLDAGKQAATSAQQIESKGTLGYVKSCPHCQSAGKACDKHKKKA